MATFRKRGNTWRAEVAKNGVRQSATFPTKAQAQDWAARIEAEILAGKRGMIPDKTFGDLLDRYAKEVSVSKRGQRWEILRIALLKQDDISKVRLSDLSATHVSAWRDRRLIKVSAGTVRREWTLMSHACTIAVKEWRWLNGNPMQNVRRPAPPAPRERVISQDEIDAILTALGDDYTTATGRVGAAFRFALATAMRCGEICGLDWKNIAGRVATLPMTKNGSARSVPLSLEAMSVLEALPKDGGSVFGLRPAIVDAIFRKAKARALVSGFTFHDARRTALTKLANKLTVMELAKLSGHRDLRILQAVYYQPNMEEMAAKLD